MLVDEFQDVSAAQFQLLTALVGPEGGSVTAVGDDDQSIYSFQVEWNAPMFTSPPSLIPGAAAVANAAGFKGPTAKIAALLCSAALSAKHQLMFVAFNYRAPANASIAICCSFYFIFKKEFLLDGTHVWVLCGCLRRRRAFCWSVNATLLGRVRGQLPAV